MNKENELLKARNDSLIEENDSLKDKFETLQRKTEDSNVKFAKFFDSSKALNMIIGSQKSLDKTGLGFKEKSAPKRHLSRSYVCRNPYDRLKSHSFNSYKAYNSFVKEGYLCGRTKQIWVPKGTYIPANNFGPIKIWVPKSNV